MDWDVEAEVVVVGGGACGLMAAVIAATFEGGVDVMLLEKNSHLMPNGELSGGLLQAPGTRFQRAAGILDDSPELMAEDIMRKNHGQADPAHALAVCRKSTDVVHWIADVLKFPIEFAPEAEWIGHSRPRMHGHPKRTGAPLVYALRDYMKRLPNLRYADNTPAQGLVAGESGAVVGVLAGREGEEVERIGCQRVVLAAGGYGRNKEMLAQYIPEMVDAPYVGSETNTGEAIRWGAELGAALVHMHGHQGHGHVIHQYNTRLYGGVITEGGIVVNATGRRFEREDQGYSEWAGIVQAQPGGLAVALWTQQYQDRYSWTTHMQESIKAGAIARNEGLRQVAERYGLPEAALEQTMREYNAGVLAGKDALGREMLPSEPMEPPFYTARLAGALAHTQGGLKVDPNGRVLRTDGRVLPNLYAGGGTAVGLSGDFAGGYMSGNGLLSAYSMGMIIGQHAVKSLQGKA